MVIADSLKHSLYSKALSILFTRFGVGEVNTTDWFREVSPSACFNCQPINCLRNILWMLFHFMPVYQTLTLLKGFLIENVFTAWSGISWLVFYYNVFFIADTKPTQALQKHPRLSIQFLLNALRGKEKGLLMVQSLAILGKEQHIQYILSIVYLKKWYVKTMQWCSLMLHCHMNSLRCLSY